MAYTIVPKDWRERRASNADAPPYWLRPYAAIPATDDLPAGVTALHLAQAIFVMSLSSWDRQRISELQNHTDLVTEVLALTHYDSKQSAHEALTAADLRQFHEVVPFPSPADDLAFDDWANGESWNAGNRGLPYAWTSALSGIIALAASDSEACSVPFYIRAHRSEVDTDQIAYFPTWDNVFRRVAVRTTPARFLARYYPHLTQLKVDYLVETWKRKSGVVDSLQISTSAEEIRAVYTAEHAPTSCMDGRHDFSQCRPYHHPTEAYGDSDLALAWFGDLSAGQVHARAIVWPTQKTYVRAYGDISTLKALLRSAGYTKADNFSGARIRKLSAHCGDYYIAPYIDGDVQTGTPGGKWIMIEEDGSYGLDSTTGLIEESDRERYQCERCEREISEDDGSWCDSCREDRVMCRNCPDHDDWSEHMFQLDGGDDWYCRSCWNDLDRCESCNDRYAMADFSSREVRERRANGTSGYCLSCTDNGRLRVCPSCDELTAADDDVCSHDSCEASAASELARSRDTETADLFPNLAPESEVPF